MKLFVSVTALIFMLFVLSETLFGIVKDESNSLLQSNDFSGKYSYVLNQNDTGAWYYRINAESKTLIIQKTIPAIDGNIAFADSVDAVKIAGLVITKLERGLFPPGVKLSELDSLKIQY